MFDPEDPDFKRAVSAQSVTNMVYSLAMMGFEWADVPGAVRRAMIVGEVQWVDPCMLVCVDV